MAASNSVSSLADLLAGLVAGAGGAVRAVATTSFFAAGPSWFAGPRSFGASGLVALRGSGISDRASTCSMLFRLAATSRAGVTASTDAAGAAAEATATFSIDAAPSPADAADAAGAATTVATPTGSVTFATGAEPGAAMGAAAIAGTGTDDEPVGIIPNLTAKYTATTPSASTDIHITRFSGVASRVRESRRGVPSMVAKMLGPKSGCRGLLLGLWGPGSPNN